MQYANRIQETTQTTGTGNLALDGATFRFKPFSSEMVNGNNFHYLLEDENGEWEIGLGEFSTNNIIRQTVLNSSNNDALISLSAGIHRVSLVFAKEDFEALAADLQNHIDDPDAHPQYTTFPETEEIAVDNSITFSIALG